MRSNYRKLGDYIELVNDTNHLGKYSESDVRGVSNNKDIIKTKANNTGRDFRNFYIVSPSCFIYNSRTSRMGDKVGLGFNNSENTFITSFNNTVFRIKNKNLLPEYLFMWFNRSEFDRYARYHSWGSSTELFPWDGMCDVELPVPSIEEQQKIIDDYNVVKDRFNLNKKLMAKLEKTAFALFNEMFPIHGHEIENEYTVLNELIDFNPKHTIKKNVSTTYVEMANVSENYMSINDSIVRPFSSGSKFKNMDTLLARITPCLENGKTAFVDFLDDDEVAFGSTEFIVMRSKDKCKLSPYWIYCLAKNENFRSYAISSMTGSSGRQRVHSDYLKEYRVNAESLECMNRFHYLATPLFSLISASHAENQRLKQLEELLLQKVA